MSEDRTEAATPKRRQEARDRGQVARSPELNTAVGMIGAFLILQASGRGLFDQLSQLLQRTFMHLPVADLTVIDVQTLGIDVGRQVILLIAPVMVGLLGIGLAVGFGQVGFGFSTKAMLPNFNRLNPITGMQRLASLQGFVDLIKSVLKLSIVGYVAYTVLNGNLLTFASTLGAGPSEALGQLAGIGLDLGLKAAGVFLVLAGADYGYQRWHFERSIRMTKQEVKEEYKQQEGNQEIKSALRRKQRQLARGRMMAKVPTADVVVTNPTHYAVALRYDTVSDPAPIVVAKGADLIAQEIKRVAKEHDVPCVENVALARALYAAVEIDEQIPFDLYQAVAEVLAFIYRLRGSV